MKRRSIAIVGLASVVALAAAAGRTKTFTYEPDTKPEDAPPLVGNTWRMDAGSYLVELQHLDDAERLALIRHRTGLDVDPFLARPGKTVQFLTFLLVLENRSEPELRFNPPNAWLVPSNNKIELPLDLAKIRSAYSMMDAEMPPAFENMRQVLFDGEVVLGAGQQAAGLLVYRFDALRFRRFNVEIPLTMSQGEPMTMKASYRRVKVVTDGT